MSQDQTNILVAIRCRPLSKKEKEQNDTKTVHILDTNLIIIIDPYATANKRTKEKRYAFDFVFQETVQQDEIFAKTTVDLLDGVLNGYNATVFAYGPTGAGKTYTMMGENDNIGIMLNSFLELFGRIETFAGERQYTVRVSYLEIYNEIVRDLLNPSTTFLDVREDPQKGVMVSDLSELNASRPEEVIECLRLGNKRRTCEPTEANLTSSRSHAVLQIIVEYTDKTAGVMGEVYSGKLSLIDLAGSERAANTKNRGIRLIEGANINRSLLALGNCINALYEANSKGIKVFIPYRDSKLTRLLKDSLGGRCRTVMIACISPFHQYYEDTHNTLEYANRAKNIKTRVEKNMINVEYHVSKYKEMIDELRNEIKQLRKIKIPNRRASNPADDNSEYFFKDLEEHFNKESKVKINFFKIQDEIDELNEQILVQENNLASHRYRSGDNNAIVGSLSATLEGIRSKLVEKEEKFKEKSEEINILERKRKEFDLKWIDLPEEQIASLRLSLQKHVIRLFEIEKEKQKIHEQNKLKYKDLYISILEDKLKERINLLEIQDMKSPANSEGRDQMYTRNFPDDKSNKSKPFSYRLQGEKYLKNKHLKSDSSLPPISPKHQPISHSKYKGRQNDDSSSTSSATDFSQARTKPIPKGKSNIPRRNFGPFGKNIESDSSKVIELPKISDKFKQSPYTLFNEDNKKKFISKASRNDLIKLTKVT
jgi:kinesin family protein 18/19